MKSASGPAAEEDIDVWYREEVSKPNSLLVICQYSQIVQHLRLIAKSEGYLRTTRYKLAFSASLPPSAEDEVKPPVWLALHEFETETVDMGKLAELTMTDVSYQTPYLMINSTKEGCFYPVHHS